MPVKQDPAIVAWLNDMDLVVWEATHPKMPFFNEKTKKMSQRENKGWVLVTLAGPGVPLSRGSGPTFSEAVRAALTGPDLINRVTGLAGAMLRLEVACREAGTAIFWRRLKLEAGFEGDDDDFVPF